MKKRNWITPTTTVLLIILAFVITLPLDIRPLVIAMNAGSALKKLLPAKKWPYPVIDSGYRVSCDLTVGCIRWLDNERVLFKGVSNANEIRTAKYAFTNDITTPVYVWNLRTNTTTRAVEVAFDRKFCAANDGYIAYARPSSPGYVIQAEGFIGQLTERQVKILSPEERDQEQSRKFHDGTLTERNRFTCREDRPHDYPGGKQSKAILKAGHGVLYWGKVNSGLGISEETKPVSYYPPNDNTPIELPAERWQAQEQSLLYSTFKNTYLLSSPEVSPGGVTNWPKDRPKPYYILSPGGAFKTEQIPVGAPAHEIIGLTKSGLLLFGYPQRTDESGGAVYLFDNGQFVKLHEGWLKTADVSPDGCRLAMSIRDTLTDKTFGSQFGSLKVIDLCKGEEK